MTRKEATDQYSKALKLGQKNYKERVVQGLYPYPAVLDEMLDENMVTGRVELGIVDIPTDQIVGTKTAGRRTAFAANFMPLLDSGTEFAAKWVALCSAHLGDEGIRDPIRCYEYLGRFYVQEGNKRVSVLKSYDSPTIPGYVIRVVPTWSDDPAVRAYYDFMASYQLTGLYRVYFSRPGSFAKLQAALGFEPDHAWTEDERQHFVAGLTYFRDAMRKQSPDKLSITPADALLVWLRVYKFEQLWSLSNTELNKSVAAVWPDIKLYAANKPVSVSTETAEQKSEADAKTAPANIFGRLLHAMFPDHLNIAFVNEYSPETSDWVNAHDLGRQYLEAVMGNKVSVQVFNNVHAGEEAAAAMKKAVENGAQVIFATTPPLIAACRKLAAQHPGIRILNCSASMPYAGVRTYYSRIYEGKFLTGAIAGAMSRDGKIGYVASNPIWGVPASINAFALGARLTNPRARIKVRWSCVEHDAMGALAADGAEVISNRDIPTPDRILEPWGLCLVKPDGTLQSLASPYWHWGNFYVKLVRSIFSGGWDELNLQDDEQAVNYWWGMSSRTVDVLFSKDLPAGVRQLAEILRKGIIDGTLDPFLRPIRSQDGQVRNDGENWFTPEEILHMDWLCDYVEGEIPSYEQLLPIARPLVRLQGVYRDQIPPEKEGTVL